MDVIGTEMRQFGDISLRQNVERHQRGNSLAIGRDFEHVVTAVGVRPSGGGRVTEILTRPLFSLFFPDLTGLVQPLSGEYAVRREILHSIPFPIGYGVETSHLIDVWQEYGLEAFAQTDLETRVHRNQTTNDLGKMSFGILQSFLNRLESNGMVDRLPEMASVFRQFQAHGDSYEQVLKEIVEEERPPMIEIPEYIKKRNALAG